MAAAPWHQRWWVRVAVAIAMGLAAGWIATHGIAGVAWSAVAAVMASAGVGHLIVLALIWAVGLAAYSTVLSAAMPGLGTRRSLTVNLTGSAVANVVPLGGALATALNWKMLRGWGHSNASFLAFSALTNALAVMTKLALPVVAVALMVTVSEHVPRVLWLTAACCAAALAAGCLAGFVWSRSRRRFAGAAGVQVLSLLRGRWRALLLGSVAYTFAQIVLLGFSLRAVGLTLPLTALVATAAIERLGTVIPLTPGGAGVAEAGAIAWLIGIGLDPAQAIAGVLLYRIFIVVMEIPVGGLVLAAWAWQVRTLRRGASRTELSCASPT